MVSRRWHWRHRHFARPMSDSHFDCRVTREHLRPGNPMIVDFNSDLKPVFYKVPSAFLAAPCRLYRLASGFVETWVECSDRPRRDRQAPADTLPPS